MLRSGHLGLVTWAFSIDEYWLSLTSCERPADFLRTSEGVNRMTITVSVSLRRKPRSLPPGRLAQVLEPYVRTTLRYSERTRSTPVTEPRPNRAGVP